MNNKFIACCRPLHWVFKIGNRKDTVAFCRNVLQMHALRHEEFSQGCEATCNGPYDNKWSKTMIGYGAEDSHFVLELTYNYPVKSYEKGNDFDHIQIHSTKAYAAAVAAGETTKTTEMMVDGMSAVSAESPDGYRFVLVNHDVPAGEDPVRMLALNVTSITRSLDFWGRHAGMVCDTQDNQRAILRPSPNSPFSLCLQQLPEECPLRHAQAFGRVAFSAPTKILKDIEAGVCSSNTGASIIKSHVALSTPGKATVEVVIVGDPDGYEICFVGDEAFRELSAVVLSADHDLDIAISEDKSDEARFKKYQRESTGTAGEGGGV